MIQLGDAGEVVVPSSFPVAVEPDAASQSNERSPRPRAWLPLAEEKDAGACRRTEWEERVVRKIDDGFHVGLAQNDGTKVALGWIVESAVRNHNADSAIRRGEPDAEF